MERDITVRVTAEDEEVRVIEAITILFQDWPPNVQGRILRYLNARYGGQEEDHVE